MNSPYVSLFVLAGLVPAIHGPTPHPVHVDVRNKSGHDGGRKALFLRAYARIRQARR